MSAVFLGLPLFFAGFGSSTEGAFSIGAGIIFSTGVGTVSVGGVKTSAFTVGSSTDSTGASPAICLAPL